jgi:hypothetical protein
MPLQDKIVKYSIYVAHNDFVDFQRVIDLRLESGSTATIAFPANPPNDWLQFSGSHTTLYMAQDEFADVTRLLQAETPFLPIFFTALNLLGIRVGAVHTELDLSQGAEAARVDEEKPQTLQEFVRRSKSQITSAQPPGNRPPGQRA